MKITPLPETTCPGIGAARSSAILRAVEWNIRGFSDAARGIALTVADEAAALGALSPDNPDRETVARRLMRREIGLYAAQVAAAAVRAAFADDGDFWLSRPSA